MLHAFDPAEARDSKKNLRVLWTRALLAARGELDDDVAATLLPPASRWIVGAALAPPPGAVRRLGWIAQRARFLDGALDGFGRGRRRAGRRRRRRRSCSSAGLDTRALRYAGRGLRFFELDLAGAVARAAAARDTPAEQAPRQLALDLETLAGADGAASAADAPRRGGLVARSRRGRLRRAAPRSSSSRRCSSTSRRPPAPRSSTARCARGSRPARASR